MKKDFLLSIVIPTRNRESYAVKVVEQILQIDSDNIQVVIQDNGDTRILPKMLSGYDNDERLRYNYTEGTTSYIENFNLAIDHADGEYLCVIGDDDGLSPQIIDVAGWAKENNIDAIKPHLNAEYLWPNSGVLEKDIDNGHLSICKITSKARVCKPLHEVEKLLNQGGQGYLSLDMVKLYHGIVRKECLFNIKRRIGKYLGGLSPDIYMSVALSLTVDKMIEIDFPLTISGTCNKSTAADAVTGRHTGKLADAPHLRGHSNYKWSELVPKFYSVETIWADSALTAIRDLGRSDMLKMFNIMALKAICLTKYPQFKDIIIEHYDSCAMVKDITRYYNSRIAVSFFKRYTLGLIRRVLRMIRCSKDDSPSRQNDFLQVNRLENIIKAGEVLQRRIVDIGIDTKTIIANLESLK